MIGIHPERVIGFAGMRTESVMMGGEQAVISGLRELDARGVVLAIDDFGTGYSSLSYLRRFPVHRLKIDQSFVRDLPGNRDAVAIARAVVGMGRGLGMRVIAEGIEREEQADFLQSIWCEDGQGYYYCKPLPPTELELWLESQGEIRSNVTLRQHG